MATPELLFLPNSGSSGVTDTDLPAVSATGLPCQHSVPSLSNTGYGFFSRRTSRRFYVIDLNDNSVELPNEIAARSSRL